MLDGLNGGPTLKVSVSVLRASAVDAFLLLLDVLLEVLVNAVY